VYGILKGKWKIEAEKLERVQKRATKLIPEISKKPYRERNLTGPKFAHIEVQTISRGYDRSV